MITRMTKVRLLGRRELLADALRAVQDAGVLHLAPPATERPLQPTALTPDFEREQRNLRRLRDDLEAVWERLGDGRPRHAGVESSAATTSQFAAWARLASRLRRRLEDLAARELALEEERGLIEKYQHLFSAFRPLMEGARQWPNATAYHVILKASEAGSVSQLRGALRAAIGERFELYSQGLPTGEIALLVIVTSEAAARVEDLLDFQKLGQVLAVVGYEQRNAPFRERLRHFPAFGR